VIAPEIARRRMQEADPVPTADDISDDLVAEVRAIIDAGIAGGGQRDLVESSERTSGTWIRRGLAVAAAFAVTIVLVGLAGLLRSDESPAEDPATTVTTVATTVAPETTVATTAPPTTAAPVETTSAPVATTIPPKPASLQISWERVPEQASLEDGWIAAVAEGDSGYVAVGGTGACPTMGECEADAAVWLSSDGVTWERIESSLFAGQTTREYSDGTVLDGEQYMNDVAWGPSGFVAVGNVQVVNPDRPVGWLGQPAIWLSPDGRQWDLLPYDEELFAGIEGLWRVVTFDGRFVAVGGSSAWLSNDGINWQRVEIDTDRGVGDVTVWNDMLVAVGGTYDGHPAAWTSSDGVTWARVTSADLAEVDGNLQGVGGNADGLVAIGTSPTGMVTAWQSENGSDWSVDSEMLGGYQEWSGTTRTALSIDRGTNGIEDDLILINGGYSATLWGTADGGENWYSAGQFDGGPLESLTGGAPAVFNTVNEALVAGDRLLAFGKVVAWSGTEDLGGLCYVDPGDGSLGSCRADAAIWVGTWDNP